MTKFKTLAKKWHKDPAYRKEYEKLRPEFELASALIAARKRAKMTQADVAEAMNTTQSVIARLEGGGQKPTIKTLERYAEATKSRLKIGLVAA